MKLMRKHETKQSKYLHEYKSTFADSIQNYESVFSNMNHNGFQLQQIKTKLKLMSIF